MGSKALDFEAHKANVNRSMVSLGRRVRKYIPHRRGSAGMVVARAKGINQ